MKRFALIIMALLAVCVSSESFAQKNKDKSVKIAKEVKQLTKKLKLTEAQVPEVSEAISARVSAEKKEKEAAITAFNAKMKEVLTEEQSAKFDKIAAKRGDRREKRANKPKKPAGDRMAKELGLEGEQKEKFSALMNERREKMQAMRNGGERQRGQGKKLRQEYEAKLKALLTAEQFAQYQKIMEDRRGDRGERRGRGGEEGNGDDNR